VAPTLPRRFVPLVIPVVIVVEDRPDALRGADERVTARPAQVDEEGFVRLLRLVGDDNDGDSHGCYAGSERQGAALRLVVAAGRGGAVGGGVVDRHRLVVGGR